MTNPPAPDLTPHLRTLCTKRCTLEPQVAAHAAEMFGVLSDPAIYEFENAPPASLDWLTQRFARLEARRSADATEQWLNWVIRLPGGALAGYVHASVMPNQSAYVAYELASQYWRRGIGSNAVTAMMEELAAQYGVNTFVAILKAGNFRSLGLLTRLGFVRGSAQQASAHGVEEDELIMLKTA